MEYRNIGDNQSKFLGKLYELLVRENIVAEIDKPGDLKTKIEKVQKYFNKLERIQERAIGNNRYLDIIKALYHDRYIIKEEDIPDSYLRTLEQQYFEQGAGRINLVNPRMDFEKQLRGQHIYNIINEQKESFDSWLNYFLSSDSS